MGLEFKGCDYSRLVSTRQVVSWSEKGRFLKTTRHDAFGLKIASWIIEREVVMRERGLLLTKPNRQVVNGRLNHSTQKQLNWKKICKGCGECCGPVVFRTAFYESNRDKIQTPPISETRDEPRPGFPGMTLPITESKSCVFLDSNKRCVIYENRPYICKMYGTVPDLKCERAGNKWSV